MATESAVFTALPNGLHESGERWRVTVFVSPRLLTDGAGNLDLTGANFPAFADWPATIANTKFTILVDGVGSFDTEPDPDSPAPDSATWLALFGKTEVRDPKFNDMAGTKLSSFPVADASKYVLDLYGQVAEALSGRLPAGHQRTAAGPRRRHRQPVVRRSPPLLPGARQRVLDHARARRGEEEDAPVALRRSHAVPRRRAGNRAPVWVFAEAYRFHDRPGRARVERAGPAAGPAQAARDRLPRLRRVLRRLPETAAAARPRGGSAHEGRSRDQGARQAASRSARRARERTGVDDRGIGAAVDQLRDLRPSFHRDAARPRRRPRRRHAPPRVAAALLREPDRRGRQRAQDGRLRREPPACERASRGAERQLDDRRCLVAAGVALERVHGRARRPQREARRPARCERDARGRPHQRATGGAVRGGCEPRVPARRRGPEEARSVVVVAPTHR